MAAEDSTLILSLKDGVSVGLAKTNASLRATAEAVSALDIRITALEGSLARVGTKTTANSAATKAATSAWSKNAAAILQNTYAYKELEAAQAKLDALAVPKIAASSIATDTIGRPYNLATGGTISAADAAAANEYAAALQRVDVAQAELAVTAKSVDLSVGMREAEVATSSLTTTILSMGTQARHAINEASNATLAFGAALVALPLASAYVAIEYQKDFASVNRALLATHSVSSALEDQLLQLTEVTPLTFKQITQIAAAGGQMGIAAGDIKEFTQTVADLTVTSNISATAAESFIRKFQLIAGVGSDAFYNLASALLNVGIHTGALEASIASIATQIVGIGKVAGFTVPQIIGLSAAIGSISANGPSLARGTVTRFITEIQKAVSSGGPALTEFANVAGVSTEKVQAAFGTAKFAGVFQSFIDGLNDVQQATKNGNVVLNDLGITSVRDVPLLLNLAAAHKLLATAMKDADSGYKDSTILAQHYGIINDTVAAKLTELKNNFGVLANQIGGAVLPVLTGLVGWLEQVGTGLAQFDKSNPGILETAAVIATVVGVVTILIGGLGKLAAAGIAIKQAILDFGILRAAIIASATATTGLAGSMGLMDIALGPIGIGIAAVGVAIAGLSFALTAAQTPQDKITASLSQMKISYSSLVKEFTDNGLDTWLTSGGGSLALFKDLNSALIESKNNSNDLFASFSDPRIVDFRAEMGKLGDNLATLSQTNLPQAQKVFDAFAAHTDGSKTSLGLLLDSTTGYKKALDQMLVTQGIAITRQNELALATGTATGSYKELTDSIKAAAAADSQYQSDLNTALGNVGPTAIGKQVTAYQNSISVLGSLNSAVSVLQGKLTTAAVKAGSTTYNGSVGLQDLTKQYQENVTAGQQWADNLIIVAQKYSQDTANQFIAAGFSITNNSILAQLAKAAPAQGKAFVNAQNTALELASTSAADVLISAGHLVTANGGKIGDATAKAIGKQLVAGFSPAQIMKEFNLQFDTNPLVPKVDTNPATAKLNAWIKALGGKRITFVAGVSLPSTSGSGANGGLYTSRGNFARGYAGGGYTGDGGKYQPAGLVHAGEFVFTKAATAAIGIGNLYSMMMAAGSRGYANGGPVASSGPTTGGVVTVQLSPYDRALLAAAGNVSLTITSGQLAAATNSQGVVASNRRSG